MATQCSVEGCEGRPKARGFCNKHWYRWYRHGHPESGQIYKGDAKAFVLKVAADLTVKECIFWPYSRGANGYAKFQSASGTLAHRYVCELAHGKPADKMMAAHSCGNGHLGCVNPRHLRWATRSENVLDAAEHGTLPQGDSHRWTKIPDSEIPAILALRGVESQASIAKRYGVSPTCIQNIQSGKSRRRNAPEGYQYA